MKKYNGTRKKTFPFSLLTKIIIGPIALSAGIYSALAYSSGIFNPAFIETTAQSSNEIDLSIFNKENGQAPGTYRVDVYLNTTFLATQDVYFYLLPTATDDGTLLPCITIDSLKGMGVKVDNYPALKQTSLSALNEQCANLTAIPHASSMFNFNQLRLDISIPLVALDSQARGYIPPEKWDAGIPAFLLNYAVSGSNRWIQTGQGENSNNDSQYINLRPGLNLGAWRLRNYSSYSRAMGGKEQSWQSAYTYAQRDIAAIKSQLLMGQSFTSGEIFDSVSFTGAQLNTDQSMLPDSQSGYAPTIRAIARTNAQVTVSQLGYTIAQKYVSPGEFVIDDLNPTSTSGDLTVTIKEEDGSEQVMIIPYAGVAQLQREGNLKYSVTSGQYRNNNHDIAKTPFSEATFGYGMPWGLTTFGGFQAASKVQTLALGIAKNMGLMGALSVDVTQAWSRLQNSEKTNGQSWRVRYNKNLVDSKTNILIAGYRYSTAGYYSLSEVLDSYDGKDSLSNYQADRRRNRTEFTISQGLWEGAGSISINYMNQDYWGAKSRTTSLGVSYNNSWQKISYGLAYRLDRNTYSNNRKEKVYNNDRLISLNVSVPFDWRQSRIYSNYNMSTSNGRMIHNAGLSGLALNDKLSWSMQQGYSTANKENYGGINSSYRGTYGTINGGYNYGHNQRSINYGLEGALVGHENGITLSQNLGETSVLVETPQAAGIAVASQSGVATDYRGYTIVPYVMPYRQNTIRLQTDSLPDDIELLTTTKNVVPTRGALVRAHFDVDKGQRVLMTLQRPNGPVPFGATVVDENKQRNNLAIVGDRGEVFLTGLVESGKLRVQWGKEAHQQCSASYQVPEKTSAASGILSLTEQCI
ncbi:fimbrial biogenesis outer membrane usher protein [Rahnella sp. SAP-1]|uniref:Fimbrial biogenesis outer membrane usher protein n=1 Tax=Rouxiella aceris TaxID=2703884 RepID=A0A848MMY6_9GAMM|nr:fimbria/pilus outer membrane usher protein [Rouxiella aceris]NMP28663.1 fimbrial biogenesis outer membrane usher protein [Rouxiella aceris]